MCEVIVGCNKVDTRPGQQSDVNVHLSLSAVRAVGWFAYHAKLLG